MSKKAAFDNDDFELRVSRQDEPRSPGTGSVPIAFKR